MELPDIVEVTITEEDRQTAEDYCQNGGCLLATAFKRTTGATKVAEAIWELFVFDEKGVGVLAIYTHQLFTAKGSFEWADKAEKPYYPEEVVGLQFTFTKQVK